MPFIPSKAADVLLVLKPLGSSWKGLATDSTGGVLPVEGEAVVLPLSIVRACLASSGASRPRPQRMHRVALLAQRMNQLVLLAQKIYLFFVALRA